MHQLAAGRLHQEAALPVSLGAGGSEADFMGEDDGNTAGARGT